MKLAKPTARPSRTQLVKFVAALLAVSTMTACSGDSSGRVAYKKVEIRNVLPPGGLQHTDAVKLLALASGEQSMLETISTIREHTASNFDWPRFWNELNLNSGIQSKLTNSTRKELFRLHKYACNKDNFDAFTNFVLINLDDITEQDFELFVGKNRLCKQSIGKNLIGIAKKSGLRTGIITSDKNFEKIISKNSVDEFVQTSLSEEMQATEAIKLLYRTDVDLYLLHFHTPRKWLINMVGGANNI